MIKAIALIRTSTIQQEIESQKEQVLEMCYSDGLRPDEVEVVGCAGASAIKVDEQYQKNIQQVYDLIENNSSIKCVYAWAIDRIGRKESILHNFREFLVERKIQLKIKANNLTLLDNEGKEDFGVKLQFSLYATLAAAEMENKKERFKRAKERNAKDGKYNGGKSPLFGYSVDELGFFIVNEEEANIIREMYECYASGNYSIAQLAIEMNERGYRRKGKLFGVDTIKNWLNSGDKFCGECETIKYPPILSKRLVEKVRKMLVQSRKCRERTYKHHYFGARLIKCLCGSHLGVYNATYVCIHRANKRVRSITNLEQCEYLGNSISAPILDGILWNVAKECHRTFLEEMNSYKRDELTKEKEVLELKMIEFGKQKEKLVVKKKRLAQSYILEALEDDEFEQLKDKLSEQENHLRVKENTCHERLNTIRRLLATDWDEKLEIENRYLTILGLDLNPNEKEMYDLVHKYITNGVIELGKSEIEGYENKYCVKITLTTIYGDIKEFWYFGKLRNGNIKTWTKDEDGNYEPYWFDEVIRTEKGITFRNSL